MCQGPFAWRNINYSAYVFCAKIKNIVDSRLNDQTLHIQTAVCVMFLKMYMLSREESDSLF